MSKAKKEHLEGIFEDWKFYDSKNTKVDDLPQGMRVPKNLVQLKIKNIVESCLVETLMTPLSSLPFLEPRVEQLYSFFKNEYNFKDIPDHLESLHQEFLELQMHVVYLQIAQKAKQKIGIPDQSIGLLTAEQIEEKEEKPSIESELKQLISAQSQFQNDDVRQRDNFKELLKELVDNGTFTTEEANGIINLHNCAADEGVYGESLMTYLMTLESEGKLPIDYVSRLFIMSLDWPLNCKMDMFQRVQMERSWQ